MTQSPSLPELPRLHRLKTDPEVYQAVLAGRKTFEIRLNDRGFRVGDELLLMETTATGEAIRAGAPLQFTGNEMRKRVSHVLSGYGLMPGWACLSFACYEAGRASRAQSEWQPIETAPKTGRTLLLGYFNVLRKWRTLRGQWFTDAVIQEEWTNSDVHEAGWFETSVECDEEDSGCWPTDPTHWMPLPAAPTQGAEGAAPQAVVGVQVETEPTRHKDCITLTALQLRHALDFAAPDFDTDEDQRETEVSIAWAPAGATHTDEGDPDPAGYKVWLTDYPEEGSIPLDESPAGFPVKSAERGCAIAAAARAALAAAPTPPVDAAPGESVAWLPLATAPKDGTIVRLLVHFIEHPLEDDNEKPIATIGGNCGDNTGEDKWQFAGWSWVQDCFTEGEGEVIGWMPMLGPTAPAATAEPSKPVQPMDDDELQDFCISLSFDQDDYTVDVIRNVERRMLGQPLFQSSVMSNTEMDSPDSARAASLAPKEREELDRLRMLVNSPELHDFARGAVLEASHQRERWGSDHDAGKTPADWLWLLGYLGGKALAAHIAGNTEKALHHTISTAAACANWHAAISGSSNTMRPGIDPAAHGIAASPAGAEGAAS